MKHLVFVFLSIVSSAVTADTWFIIDLDKTLCTYVNYDRAIWNNRNVQFWQINLDRGIASLDHVKSKIEIDCKNQRHRGVQTFFYDYKGDFVHTNENPYSWMPIVPDSTMDITYKAFCRKALPPEPLSMEFAHTKDVIRFCKKLMNKFE